MDCRKDAHLQNCNCSYEPCSRKGVCCECLRYHLQMRELPACCFPDNIERTYNRSFEKFVDIVTSQKV